MDTATKTGIDAAKTASKRLLQKMADVTGYLIGKPKEKAKKVEEIYIPPEKRQQIIDDLKLF